MRWPPIWFWLWNFNCQSKRRKIEDWKILERATRRGIKWFWLGWGAVFERTEFDCNKSEDKPNYEFDTNAEKTDMPQWQHRRACQGASDEKRLHHIEQVRSKPFFRDTELSYWIKSINYEFPLYFVSTGSLITSKWTRQQLHISSPSWCRPYKLLANAWP